MRPFVRQFDGSVHTERTRLATFTKLNSLSWGAQVRLKGKYVNETFLRRKDAEEWALEIERRIDRGESAIARTSRHTKTFRRSDHVASRKPARGRQTHWAIQSGQSGFSRS
jgi:hypothetical protein